MAKVISFDKDGVHFVVTQTDARFTFAKKVNTETGVGSKGRPSKFSTASVKDLFVVTGEDDVQLELEVNPVVESSDDVGALGAYSTAYDVPLPPTEADLTPIEGEQAQNDGHSNGRVPSEEFVKLD